MANDRTSILGDIKPVESSTDDTFKPEPEPIRDHDNDEDLQSMEGGSQHGVVKHSGSRDVTEGTTGGTGVETGGTRNYRSGSGATGGDIGNRPE